MVLPAIPNASTGIIKPIHHKAPPTPTHHQQFQQQWVILSSLGFSQPGVENGPATCIHKPIGKYGNSCDGKNHYETNNKTVVECKL